MNHQTKAIMDVIRERCGLKELSFGCEVEYPVKSYMNHRGVFVSRTLPNDGGCAFFYNVLEPRRVGLRRVCSNYVTIIGHPVHLEHLMRAIPQSERIRIATDGTFCTATNGDMGYKLNIALTVEQNLEQNEALREWLYELICKEV